MVIDVTDFLSLVAIIFMGGLTFGLCACIAITQSRPVAYLTAVSLCLTIGLTVIWQSEAFAPTHSQVERIPRLLASLAGLGHHMPIDGPLDGFRNCALSGSGLL